MKAVILDMFGVILKQTGEEFYSYVRQFFPERTEKEIYTIWNRADLGEISSLEVWRQLGFQGNLEEREKEFLDTQEVNGGCYEFASEAGTAIQAGDPVQRFQQMEPLHTGKIRHQSVF